MKRIIILYLLAVFSFPGFATAASFSPPQGKILLLVGQDRDTIAHYISATGNIPGGTMFYTSVQEMKGLQKAVEYGSGPQDGQALLQSYPYSTIQIGLYMVDGLNNTIVGKYDANLKDLADWIKKANRPVYLRIGYEFDNPENHYEPGLYKQAFRYVVDFLRKQEVRNAAYVWHSYLAQEYVHPWMDWYPGDDYVDWFGASIFTTALVPSATHLLKWARLHHKLFMIAESSPMGLYTTKGKMDWFNHIFQFIKDNNVEAFCYIDSNWDVMPMFASQHWGDARIEEAPEIKDLWLKEINEDRYLKSSPGLFESLGGRSKGQTQPEGEGRQQGKEDAVEGVLHPPADFEESVYLVIRQNYRQI